MFLSAYHFDGDPAELAAAHDRLAAQFPSDALDLHVCVQLGGGIVVFDACPSQTDFIAFSQSPEFRNGLVAAGLPEPRIEPLGDVHSAHLRDGVHS